MRSCPSIRGEGACGNTIRSVVLARFPRALATALCVAVCAFASCTQDLELGGLLVGVSPDDNMAPSMPLAGDGDRVFVLDRDSTYLRVTRGQDLTRRWIQASVANPSLATRIMVVQFSSGPVPFPPQLYGFYYRVSGDVRGLFLEVKNRNGAADFFVIRDLGAGGWRKGVLPGFERVSPSAVWEVLFHFRGTQGQVDVIGFADPDRVGLQ